MPDLAGGPAEGGGIEVDGLPHLKNVVLMAGDAGAADRAAHFTGWASFVGGGEGVSEGSLRERKASLSADEVINMQYTSGDDGFP